MALEHFKRSFEKQGFMDSNFQAWPERKNDTRPGGALLQQTGHLRDSTQITEATMKRIIIANDAPYAKIHNEGGIMKIRVTKKMRKYFWFMYKATGQEKWKYMALTTKSSFMFRMPKRQFIGQSQNLNQRIDRAIVKRIITEFKQA
jgi:phage gpG-like protein